jgi:alpha-D-ribose 1-methylphosphonate 5-triphosphate synthase subunit PhnL
MAEIILETIVKQDAYTDEAAKMFDITIEERSRTTIQDNIRLPETWKLGVIYGPSGSGKSTLLKKFGAVKIFKWDDRPIISNLDAVSPEKAHQLLAAVGLSSVPSWLRPYHCLSVGEQFRATLARALAEAKDGDVVLIDEFTSVVDRNVAKAASCAFAKAIKRSNLRAVIATCHSDILDWLEPDWAYNPVEGETQFAGGWKRPAIALTIRRVQNTAWKLFSPHHYLTAKMNASSRVYGAFWNGILVAVTCVLRFPHGHIKNGWRLSRSVVLPDYQGLSIGAKLTDFIASCIRAGTDEKGNIGRCYARTTHPAMIAYRVKTGYWREAGGSRRPGNESPSGRTTMAGNKGWKVDAKTRYSFEYVGAKATDEQARVFWGELWQNTKPATM